MKTRWYWLEFVNILYVLHPNGEVELIGLGTNPDLDFVPSKIKTTYTEACTVFNTFCHLIGET